MDQLIKDIRYGLRGLWKRPGFTAVAVITLALGIGANAAIFSVVNAVLLRPLQFHDPERLAILWEDASFVGFPRNTPAPANYVDWKNQAQSFADVAATHESSMNLTGDGEPERVPTRRVTANFFSLLGVQPLIGRSFLPEEDRPQANKVAVLSYSLWQSRYGGDRNILDRVILLNGEKHTVVGVMPAGFQWLETEERLFVPLALEAEELASRGNHYLTVIARLKPGVSMDQAQAEMDTIMARIAKEHPEATAEGKLGAIVMPLHEQLAGDARRPLLVLLVAVAFVLLIACANIASLLLARAAGRRREIAVRSALGASRLHIVRQLLTESLLLSTFGGVAGLLLAIWSFGFFERLIPEGLKHSTVLKLDGSILLFALLTSVVTGLVFGLIPALQSSRVDLNESLKQSGGRSGGAGSSSRLRSGIIVFEVSLSLVLLVGAVLLIQTLFQLFNQYSVLAPEKVLTMRTALPLSKYDEPGKRHAFYQNVLHRVEAIPGVASAGYVTAIPLTWKGGTTGVFPEGTRERLPGVSYDATHRQVSADYLQTMSIPLRQGRYFTAHDNEQSMPVAIVNETMAREYWPNGDAVGRRFKLGDPADDLPWLTVVGIVGDVRQMGIDVPVKGEMYLPYGQVAPYDWYAPRDLALRTNGDPSSLVGAVREAIRSVDPDQPVSNVATLGEVLGQEAAQRRLGMILLTAFAVLALLLASLGIYGVLAYFVAQHRNEIGVRLALGATPARILLLVLRKGMALTMLGVAIGLAASFVLTRLMTSLLFGVKAVDPLTFAAVPVLLVVIALLACWIPARRAAKVDPMVALRYE
ncbi:MAG TPA: ABC transporter permease [Pyrinomonadaceae bacterium]|nr:ABC transporter permease [Pyrinomonadaceae bacterium]